MFKSQKGFTLIELLVVIAIIGILSAVVLASLNQARIRGTDASITATINGVRATAELFFNTQATPAGYTDLCTHAPVAEAQASVNRLRAGAWTCRADATRYAVSGRLADTPAGAQRFYCVDSRGTARVTATPVPGTGTIECPPPA